MPGRCLSIPAGAGLAGEGMVREGTTREGGNTLQILSGCPTLLPEPPNLSAFARSGREIPMGEAGQPEKFLGGWIGFRGPASWSGPKLSAKSG